MVSFEVSIALASIIYGFGFARILHGVGYVFSKDIKGWVLKNDIWGVYKKEIYNLSFLQPLINQYWKFLDLFLHICLNFLILT